MHNDMEQFANMYNLFCLYLQMHCWESRKHFCRDAAIFLLFIEAQLILSKLFLVFAIRILATRNISKRFDSSM